MYSADMITRTCSRPGCSVKPDSDQSLCEYHKRVASEQNQFGKFALLVAGVIIGVALVMKLFA